MSAAALGFMLCRAMERERFPAMTAVECILGIIFAPILFSPIIATLYCAFNNMPILSAIATLIQMGIIRIISADEPRSRSEDVLVAITAGSIITCTTELSADSSAIWLVVGATAAAVTYIEMFGSSPRKTVPDEYIIILAVFLLVAMCTGAAGYFTIMGVAIGVCVSMMGLLGCIKP